MAENGGLKNQKSKGLLTNKKTNNFLDLIVDKKQNTLENEIVFSCVIFMLFGLPTKKLNNITHWTKSLPHYDISITKNPKFEIPYGAYARMNQIFIDSEVVKKDTNIIELGHSFSEYINKLGYTKGGKTNHLIYKQLLNYITSIISFTPKTTNKNHFIGMNTPIARKWNISFDLKIPDQMTLEKGKIILDEDYAKFIKAHAVPINMNFLRIINNKPLAIDFYRYLAYRNNALNNEISYPDHLLFEQLGTNDANLRQVRARLKSVLKLIKQYWPVQADFQDGYFILKPSPPAVQKKIK